MMHLPAFLVVLLATHTYADSMVVHLGLSSVNCVMGVMDALAELKFADISKDANYYAGYCNSEIFKTSMVASASSHCNPVQRKTGWGHLSDYCKEYGETDLEAWDSVQSRVPDNAPIFNVAQGVLDTSIINSTIIIDRDSFNAGFKTENVWEREMNFHHAFGWSMYIFVGVVLLFGVSRRLFALYYAKRISAFSSTINRADTTAQEGRLQSINRIYEGYLGTPALGSYRHLSAQGWTGRLWSVPTRIEAVLIFIYVLVNIAFTCANYDLFSENLYWPGELNEQLARYIADRTAIMCFYSLPLLWTLGGRNDFILWITGWSFASVNQFHRWVARVATAHAFVHSVLWTYLEIDGLAAMWAERYWRVGVFAIVLMVLLCVPMSLKPIRDHYYELFLMFHILTAFVLTVLLFYHVKVYDGMYDSFLWVCVGVWAFDRFIRIVRIGYLSFNAAKGNNATLALSSTCTTHKLLRLSVKTSLKHAPPAGSYYFIYNPLSIKPWENHPFTLARAEQTANGESVLHFLISPRRGATASMAKKLETEQGQVEGEGAKNSVLSRVLLEGPYGAHHHLEIYEIVLMIAGGSGISAILPYISHIQSLKKSSKAVSRQIHIVWAVRSIEYASDVLKTELRTVLAEATEGLKIALTLHVTNEISREASLSSEDTDPENKEHMEFSSAEGTLVTRQSPNSLEKDTEKAPEKSSQSNSTITSVNGRPDMQHVLSSAMLNLVGNERIGVLACGPGGMLDDLRNQVCRVLKNKVGGVNAAALEYFEDGFGW